MKTITNVLFGVALLYLKEKMNSNGLSFVALLIGLSSFSASGNCAPRPSGIIEDDCVPNKNHVSAVVSYISLYGDKAPVALDVGDGDLDAYLACDGMVTECAGVSNLDKRVVTAKVTKEAKNTYIFTISENDSDLIITCRLDP